MKLDPKNIAPSQDFLKPNTVRFILDCFTINKLSELPPAPIVRQDEEQNYVAIDGHNLLAVCAYLGESSEVHLAKSADDGLPETTNANKIRNQELRLKYELSMAERDRVRAEGVTSFRDLIAKYPDLFSQRGK